MCTLWNGPSSFTPAYDLKLSQTILDIINLGSACELASGGSADETSIYNDASTSPPCQKKERESNRSKEKETRAINSPQVFVCASFRIFTAKSPQTVSALCGSKSRRGRRSRSYWQCKLWNLTNARFGMSGIWECGEPLMRAWSTD